MSDTLENAMHDAAAKGRLIEAGWISLRHAAIPPGAPAIQIEEMRNAFFAGARHIFSSLMTILDGGDEPTTADLTKMLLIERELDEFIRDFSARRLPTEGNA